MPAGYARTTAPGFQLPVVKVTAMSLIVPHDSLNALKDVALPRPSAVPDMATSVTVQGQRVPFWARGTALISSGAAGGGRIASLNPPEPRP